MSRVVDMRGCPVHSEPLPPVQENLPPIAKGKLTKKVPLAIAAICSLGIVGYGGYEIGKKGNPIPTVLEGRSQREGDLGLLEGESPVETILEPGNPYARLPGESKRDHDLRIERMAVREAIERHERIKAEVYGSRRELEVRDPRELTIPPAAKVQKEIR